MPAVFERIGAAVDYIVRLFFFVTVDGEGAAGFVSFVGGGADFFLGVHVVAVVGDELDEIGAVENIFADGFANFLGAVGINIFVAPDGAHFRRSAGRLSAEGSDDFSGGENRGAGEPAFVDGVADVNGGVAGFVADVADCSDACVQERLRDFEALEDAHSSADFEIIFLEWGAHVGEEESDVSVRIHDAGHDPFVREIDDLGIGGDLDGGAEFGDLLVFDEDDLIFGDRACGGID